MLHAALHADASNAAAIEGVHVVMQGALRGISHALSNRVAAIAALGACLVPDEPMDAELLEALRAEGGRLEELLHLQRLVGGTSGPAEAVHLPDLVPGIVALHGQQAAMRDLPLHVETDAAVVPVRVRPSALAQALLAMLGAAGACARGARRTQLTLRTDGDTTTTRMTVEARWPPATRDEVDEDQVLPPAAALLHAAGWLLADADALVQLIALDDGVRIELALPTLLERKRREQVGVRVRGSG